VFDCTSSENELRLDPKEHDAFEWVRLSEMRNFKLIGFLTGMLETRKSETDTVD
jgi:hypothetical protein